MSVLIKNMKMPKNCDECKMLSTHRIWGEPIIICEANDRELGETEEYERDEKRLFDCPLIEIPYPHGRIADMDEAIKCIEEVKGKDAELAISLIEWACGKRTIIEAEDGDAE